MTYKPRIVDAELSQRLSSAGAVVIQGPKACGKTETALQVAKSSVLLDTDVSAIQALAVEPRLVLEGDTPRLLDEWQVEPKLWNLVRREVDDRKLKGQFILTGSALPNDHIDQHTGAGRFSILRMRTMSLFESGNSNGSISLARLLGGESPTSQNVSLQLRELAELITKGGWPAQQSNSTRDAMRAARDYLTQIREVDVSRVLGQKRDTKKIGQVISSLARNIATEATVTVLEMDVRGTDDPVSRKTISQYLEVLERLMIVENLPAWATHLRSKSILRSSPKWHFVDPSLAVATLSANPDSLIADLKFLGFLFESMVIRDLRIYSQPLDGSVYHYRDSSGVEVDAIVELADGRWGAVEVKLGQGMIDSAASNLLKFASLIDVKKAGSPSFLAVVIPEGYGYQRDDGVMVIPIAALGP